MYNEGVVWGWMGEYVADYKGVGFCSFLEDLSVGAYFSLDGRLDQGMFYGMFLFTPT